MAALSDNARGAVLMMVGMAAFTSNDALMKLVLVDLPLFQALFLRGISVSIFFALLAWWMGVLHPERLPRADRVLILVRTLAEAFAAFFFFTALVSMSLANATAILQAVPLTITLGAALFLGEAVGWRRILAILVGFTGVMLIVRPGTDAFDVAAIWALLSVACVTLRDLVTRRMSSSAPSVLVAFAAAIGVTMLAGIASVSDTWVMPEARVVGLLFGAKVFIVFGYLLSVMAVRVGEMGHVAPFRYTGLLWALVLGFVVFGDWPDGVTLVGAGLVVATGLYTFARERRLQRSTAQATPMR